MTTNFHEELGRIRKLTALVERIDAHCSAVGLDPHRHALHVAAMLRTWPQERWNELAVSCGQRPPSATTTAQVLARYIARASK